MKNLKSIIVIFAISIASVFSTYAENEKPVEIKTTQKLRTEIVTLLGTTAPFELTKTTTVEVSFMINNKNEVVVVTVNSDENQVNNFVKNKLNYKKLAVNGVKKGEIYKVPVTIKKAK